MAAARRRRPLRAATVARIAFVGFWLLFLLVPLYWMFITSIKPSNDYLAVPPVWFPDEPTLVHYSAALYAYRGLDGLINNAGGLLKRVRWEDATDDDYDAIMDLNARSVFAATKAAAPHLRKNGGFIINTTSITAYRGHKTLIDYAATKGAIVSLTRSLSQALVDKGIRVNGVAPGPIWTPLIPASFGAQKTAEHGESAPMERAGQPNEVAPCYVFLASEDASYISGQILHPNGGNVVNA